MANNLNIYEEQFEELREMLYFADTQEDLDAIGANTDEWSSDEWDKWQYGINTDSMVNKAFCGYSFTCDDFFCTAGQYDKYPDKG